MDLLVRIFDQPAWGDLALYVIFTIELFILGYLNKTIRDMEEGVQFIEPPPRPAPEPTPVTRGDLLALSAGALLCALVMGASVISIYQTQPQEITVQLRILEAYPANDGKNTQLLYFYEASNSISQERTIYLEGDWTSLEYNHTYQFSLIKLKGYRYFWRVLSLQEMSK